MKRAPPRRRSLVLLSAGLLVVVLVGGRWLALETAERAWAASIAGGGTYLRTRDFARLVSGLVLFVTIAWGTGNLLFVYRTIGSVQLPRRLGDLEIVEAVPQRVLLAGTIVAGLVYGSLLALGTGDWWMQAVIATRAPVFGVTDPVLHRDLGYYVAQLPWAERVRGLALTATVSATALVAFLYLGIGSLQFRRWLPYASAHARAHLGVLLAAVGLTLTWGALLDPVETVAGLHGALTRGALALRIPAAPFVVALGLAAVVASLLWVARERAALLVASWGVLLGGSFLVYVVLPAAVGGTPVAALAADQQRFEGLAFGADSLAEQAPPGFETPAVAVAALPVWDATRVLAAAGRRRELLGPHAGPAAAALSPHRLGGGGGDGGNGRRATWVVAPMPDLEEVARVQPAPDWTEIHRGTWARAGRPFAAVESDTGLAFEPLLTRDSTTWFGSGFREFAVAPPDSWPGLRGASIPLVAGWRRTALAWSLQSPELARGETDGLLLLWRRDVRERLERLAPMASFDDPTPVVADGTLWWIAYGYLAAEAFPLAQPVQWDGRDVRYLRAGLVGAVSAATGDTRVFLAPGADSLAGAWGRLFAALIRPAADLPAALGVQLPYPPRGFRVAAALAARWRGDSLAWIARPRDPFELAAPPPEPAGSPASDRGSTRIWTAQGFQAGDPAEFVALVAGAMTAGGPRLLVWRPRPAVRLPGVLVGSPTETAPGVLRLWSVEGGLFSIQALFAESARGGPAARIDTLFLTWGERHGQGPTAAEALRALLAGVGGRGGAGVGEAGGRGLADSSLTARWAAARRLAAQADAALAAGDLEAFGRYYNQLKELLGLGRRKLAPTPRPR